MSLIKWNRPVPAFWPSMLDDDFFKLADFAEDKGLNVYETDDSVVVEAELPGIPEDDVNVTIEGNILTISGKSSETQEEKDKKKVVYKSSRQSAFTYSTSLPRMVDATKAEAEVSTGVVTVTVPKTEEEKPKKIEVKKKS